MCHGGSTRCHEVGFGMMEGKVHDLRVEHVVGETDGGEEESGEERHADWEGCVREVEFGEGGVDSSPEAYEGSNVVNVVVG